MPLSLRSNFVRLKESLKAETAKQTLQQIKKLTDINEKKWLTGQHNCCLIKVGI